MTQALGSLPLGGTEAGKRWCRKALHPADHSVLSAPLPGGATVPTVSSYYTQVVELHAEELLDQHITGWDAEIFLRQDPVLPVAIRITTNSEVGSLSREFPWLNNQVSDYRPWNSAGEPVTCNTRQLGSAYRAFAKTKNFYRMTHAGLTIEHVCSSTTNQGTVTSAQYRIEPVNSNIAGYPLAVKIDDKEMYGTTAADGGHYPLQAPSGDGTFTWFRNQQLREYCEGPMPETSLLQATNAYTGKAVNGLYIPLKLTNPEKMVNVDQQYVLMGYGTRQSALDTPIRGTYYQHKVRTDGSIGWPYYCFFTGSASPVFAMGSRECGPSVSHTVIKGLDPHASLRLYLRVGVEFVVETSSELAAFARAPPLPDTLALQMYQEISSCLKDAYTQDYNDRSKLLEVIDKLAKRIVPAIDKGLNFFAKIPGNPWGGAAAGLRTLTSAYLEPAGSSKRSKKRGNGGSRKGGGSTASSSSLARAGSTVSLSDGSGGVIKAKVISITKPNGQKKTVRV